MNKQIKVKELPKDWLVLDHHVESGPVDFVSVEYKCQCGTNNINTLGIGTDKTSGLQVCCWCGKPGFSPKETFGTKHIQLVYVNVNVSEDGTVWGGDGQTVYGYVSNKVYKDIEELSIDKDFFIYKVTEEK